MPAFAPVPVEERQDTQFYKIFFVWFSANVNILSFSAGTLGPGVFGLSIRDSCLTILFFQLLFCVMPAFACVNSFIPLISAPMIPLVLHGKHLGDVTFEPATARGVLSFASTLAGFTVTYTPLGSDYTTYFREDVKRYAPMAYANPALLMEPNSWKIFLYSYFGFILSIIPLQCTGAAVIASASSVPLWEQSYTDGDVGGLLEAMLELEDVKRYAPITYANPALLMEPNSWKIFLYSYFGFILSIIPLQCTGAAVIASASSVPLWEQSYTNGDVGGLLEAMLEPVHGFGKFLTVLLSLSVVGNMAMTVPRYFFSVLGTAIVIALAIAGQHRFYETLVNFLGLLGYWSAAYVIVIFLEHLYFRKGRFDLYDTTAWNTPSLLPTGIAAVAAVIFAFGPVVPCMDQIWYVGPVAETTGDIGFEVAFAASAIFYFVFRWFEIRWRGRL
ncbi:Purine-cytosine permease fcyB [Leucoagaricus sp. SymC.cos]|nr:Purine-cytosine permease fcyB [Leucoagaricus sp. SymC.cos]